MSDAHLHMSLIASKQARLSGDSIGARLLSGLLCMAAIIAAAIAGVPLLPLAAAPAAIALWAYDGYTSAAGDRLAAMHDALRANPKTVDYDLGNESGLVVGPESGWSGRALHKTMWMIHGPILAMLLLSTFALQTVT